MALYNVWVYIDDGEGGVETRIVQNVEADTARDAEQIIQIDADEEFQGYKIIGAKVYNV